jgi:hypothetical protein
MASEKGKTMVTNAVEDSAWSPFRTPAARWERAFQLRGEGRRATRRDDPLVREATGYLRALTQPRDNAPAWRAAWRKYPRVFEAHAIHAGGGPARDEIEARLLAGQSNCEIERHVGVAAGVIEAYHGLFFDVRGALAAGDLWWILRQAVGLGKRSRPSEGDCWRYCAVAGGVFVLDLLVADFLGRVEAEMPERHLLASKARLLAREFAESLCPDPAVAREILKEGSRLFRTSGPPKKRRGGDLLAVQCDSLRLCDGPNGSRGRRKAPKRGGFPPASVGIPVRPADASNPNGNPTVDELPGRGDLSVDLCLGRRWRGPC